MVEFNIVSVISVLFSILFCVLIILSGGHHSVSLTKTQTEHGRNCGNQLTLTQSTKSPFFFNMVNEEKKKPKQSVYI